MKILLLLLMVLLYRDAQLNATNPYTYNEKEVNHIYLQTVAKGILEFTPQQMAAIAAIAHQCPLSGGNAVYRARGMYALVADAAYNDADACAIQGLQYKNVPAAANVAALTFVPNPATNEVRILLPDGIDKKGVLYFYNTLGQVVLSLPIDNRQTDLTVSIQHLSVGLYYVQLTQEGGIRLTQKLSVIR